MSNQNYNGGRGGRSQTKATLATEHKFGGSHQANPSGGRMSVPTKGSMSRVDKPTKGDKSDKGTC